MKAFIRIIERSYRTTEHVKVGDTLHEVVKKIDARIKRATILGAPVLTKYSAEGKEKIVKIFGIPILSHRRELWDHLRQQQT